MEKAFPGLPDKEHALGLPVRVALDVDRPPIAVAEVDFPALRFAKPRRQRHADPRSLDSGLLVVSAYPVDVRRVGEDPPRLVLESIPLLQEVVPAVVADLSDVVPMRDRYFVEVRGIDDEFATVGDVSDLSDVIIDGSVDVLAAMRVAIAPIREPTEAMIAAYIAACDDACVGTALSASRVLEVLIDAALIRP